ncbi:epoxide hydrolase family protein [Novosphingobium sp. JCM 18896]|uniref:epoxide hydrolase family protein n=1 Tax=Novosphingobium sp. JCM 18896 TaxID=2989731 RepID=UPI0022225B99|nr:epoxide hydrolase family protein [Novosphingobium sp. JCM 18896]MCW1428320.1 epoxide hydrolase [Novosphingobium sp. JCM 18896]
MIDPFRIDVPQAVLDDLHDRLARTRWTADFANDQWAYGANAAYVRELAEHWRERYDWRAREAMMNAFPQFRTTIDGVPVHFIHVKGKGPNPVPLLLNHGWPWTFWDFHKVIGPLTDPAAHGGDPADAFDVIVPSLPGYGFSTPLTKTGQNFWTTADLWVELMTRLGYDRFATQGGDWGAFISAQLGHKHADRVIGVHLHTPAPLDFMTAMRPPDPADFAPEEAELLQKSAHMMAEEVGYFMLQRSKPQTPAVGLNDSPAGLLAWIVEKRRSWADTQGEVERRFTKDELIDTVMLYWVTESYHTSARYYYEAAHNPWTPSHDRMPVVEAPVGIPILPAELTVPTRKWAERYYNLQHWTRLPEGGHFAPMEVPDLLVADIRTFFRGLRAPA